MAASLPASQPASLPASLLASLLATKQLAALPASLEVPEQVTVGYLSRAYQPAKVKHKHIADKLDAAVRKSSLATHFHGEAATLCAGCHHHAPAGTRPAQCRSCHAAKGDPRRDKPALKVAFHRQCMGCHQELRLKNGCTDCHAKGGKR